MRSAASTCLCPLPQGTAAGSDDIAAKRGRGAAFARGLKLVVLTVVLGALVLVGCGKSTATSAGSSSAGVTSSVPAAGAAGGGGDVRVRPDHIGRWLPDLEHEVLREVEVRVARRSRGGHVPPLPVQAVQGRHVGLN